MEKLTKLEIEVLNNIVNSEYMDVTGEQMINWSVWSFSATNERKDLAGALGSLTKKGYTATDDTEEDHTCCITEKGFEVIKKLSLI